MVMKRRAALKFERLYFDLVAIELMIRNSPVPVLQVDYFWASILSITIAVDPPRA